MSDVDVVVDGGVVAEVVVVVAGFVDLFVVVVLDVPDVEESLGYAGYFPHFVVDVVVDMMGAVVLGVFRDSC